MSFSSQCALYFWAGWAAACIAFWGLLYVELSLRAPDYLSFYVFEAWLGLLAPFITLWLLDSASLRIYQAVWFELYRQGLGVRIIEPEGVDRLRSELRGSLLLRWFRPPKSDDLRSQLMTASLWYPALVRPVKASWHRRYGEWVVDIWLGYTLLFLSWVGWFVSPTQTMTLISIGATCIALMVIGYSSVRLAARRQAILDYFTAWRGERDG